MPCKTGVLKIFVGFTGKHLCRSLFDNKVAGRKTVVLKNFVGFTGKHLCRSLFCNKSTSLRPATLLKKRLGHRCFLVNFAKFLRAPFFIEHHPWLPLDPGETKFHVMFQLCIELCFKPWFIQTFPYFWLVLFQIELPAKVLFRLALHLYECWEIRNYSVEKLLIT